MYVDLVNDYARLLRDLAYVSSNIIYKEQTTPQTLVDVLKDYFDESTDVEAPVEVKYTLGAFTAMMNCSRECLLASKTFDFNNVPMCASYADEKKVRNRIEIVSEILRDLLNYIPYNDNPDLIRSYDYYNQIMHNVKVITRLYDEFNETVYRDFQMDADYDSMCEYLESFCDKGISQGPEKLWETLNYTCELLCKFNKFAIRLSTANCFHVNIEGVGKCINDSNIVSANKYGVAKPEANIVDYVFVDDYDWKNYNYIEPDETEES